MAGVRSHGLGAIHALRTAERRQLIAVRCRRILDAAIGVEDQGRPWSPPVDRLAQRAQGQADVPTPANGPGKDASRMLVEDDRQVAPLITDLQVGDTADPHPIRSIGQDHELAVRDAGEERAHARAVAVGDFRAQVVFAHQERHPLSADAFAQRTQSTVNARAAVMAPMRRVDLANPVEQLRVALGPRTGWASAPGIEAAARHAIEPAQHRDPVRFPHRFDELEDFALRSEANRMAFFRTSCSSWSRL